MLVLSLSAGSSWTERINQVKTLARDSEGMENELLGLAREIQNVLAPYLAEVSVEGSTQKAEQNALRSGGVNDLRKQKQVPLIDAANDWRSRNHLSTALDLSDDSLIYFITTEGLVSILVNEKQGIYPAAIKPFFPNKHELITFLEHYVAIRAAVAHNQPITLITLRRLEDMREDLEKRIYRSQSQVS